MDDSRDMVWVLNNINEFYGHESCGQCTPCREGSLWMQKITARMLDGGSAYDDADLLRSVADNIAGRTICAFGEACAWPTQSFVAKFRAEFLAYASKTRKSSLAKASDFASDSAKVSDIAKASSDKLEDEPKGSGTGH